jgi:flavin-dependent dehydrogenase
LQVDIIGGGLSGLATAISIKERDPSIDVFVHEKHAHIGYNHDARKCGEAHSIESFSLKWKPPSYTIASPIYYAEYIAGKKTWIYERTPDSAWILDRPKYIDYLGKKAKELDVEFILKNKISDIFSLQGDVIVDASGCPSVAKKALSINQRLIGCGYQQTIKNCSEFQENRIKIIINENFGYFWLFPRNIDKKEVNIGVGIFNNKHIKLPLMLESFKKQHNITGTVEYTTGGLIPGGLQFPLRYKNILFVGDAGVGTLPSNGQGIYRALMSGDIAGKYIVKQDLKGYTHQIIRHFIKMDVIQKSFIRLASLLKHINPYLVIESWNLYQSFNYKLSFFKSEFETIH